MAPPAQPSAEIRGETVRPCCSHTQDRGLDPRRPFSMPGIGLVSPGYECAPVTVGDLNEGENRHGGLRAGRSATDEVREKADDVGDAARRGAEETKEGAESVADRVSDAVEDVIPGDSDKDGH